MPVVKDSSVEPTYVVKISGTNAASIAAAKQMLDLCGQAFLEGRSRKLYSGLCDYLFPRSYPLSIFYQPRPFSDKEKQLKYFKRVLARRLLDQSTDAQYRSSLEELQQLRDAACLLLVKLLYDFGVADTVLFWDKPYCWTPHPTGCLEKILNSSQKIKLQPINYDDGDTTPQQDDVCHFDRLLCQAIVDGVKRLGAYTDFKLTDSEDTKQLMKRLNCKIENACKQLLLNYELFNRKAKISGACPRVG